MDQDIIAALISKDPDLLAEGIGKKLTGSAIVGLAALGLFGSGGKPKARFKVPTQAVISHEPQQKPKEFEKTTELVRPEKPIKKKQGPKFLKKPPTKTAQHKDALDRLWSLVAQSVGKKEEELTREDFELVVKMYASRYGGGSIDRKTMDVILYDAGFSHAARLAAPDLLLAELDKDGDGVLQLPEIMQVFFK